MCIRDSHYETTASTKMDIFLLTQRSLYLVHESFQNSKHRFAVDAGSGRDVYKRQMYVVPEVS